MTGHFSMTISKVFGEVREAWAVGEAWAVWEVGGWGDFEEEVSTAASSKGKLWMVAHLSSPSAFWKIPMMRTKLGRSVDFAWWFIFSTISVEKPNSDLAPTFANKTLRKYSRKSRPNWYKSRPL